MIRWLLWLLAGALLGGIVHLVAVLILPRTATQDAYLRLSPIAPVNTVAAVQQPEQLHPKREPMNRPVHEAQPLTVLYDGTCPSCRREIDLYRGLQPLRSDSPVCYADVSDAALPLPAGTTRRQLLARFHVRDRDGELLSGAQAFLALWAALPGWRWLAQVGRLPGAAWAMERTYRLFLRWRPALQRWARRLDARGPEGTSLDRPNSHADGSR